MSNEIPDATIKPSEILTQEQLDNRASIEFLSEEEAIQWYCEGYRDGKLGEYRGEERLARLVNWLRQEDEEGRETMKKYRESDLFTEDQRNVIELLLKYGVNISQSEFQHFADNIESISKFHLAAIYIARGGTIGDETVFRTQALAFTEKAYITPSQFMSEAEFSAYFVHELFHLLSNSFDKSRRVSKGGLTKPGHFFYVNEWVVDFLVKQIARTDKILYPQTPFMDLFDGIVSKDEIVHASFSNDGYYSLINKIESSLGQNAFNAILVYLSSFKDGSFYYARGFMEGKNKLTLTRKQIEKAGYTEQEVTNPNVVIDNE